MVVLKRLANHSTKGDVTSGYVLPSENDLRHWASVIEKAILNAARGARSSPVTSKDLRHEP